MKKISKILMLLTVFSLLVTSCQKEEISNADDQTIQTDSGIINIDEETINLDVVNFQYNGGIYNNQEINSIIAQEELESLDSPSEMQIVALDKDNVFVFDSEAEAEDFIFGRNENGLVNRKGSWARVNRWLDYNARGKAHSFWLRPGGTVIETRSGFLPRSVRMLIGNMYIVASTPRGTGIGVTFLNERLWKAKGLRNLGRATSVYYQNF